MSKYENLSKEQLLKIVEKQEKELKNKKYGLVWDSEREPEQVVLDCENNLPVLKRVRGKEVRTNDEEDNILIEGDNYHALTVLNYTHKGKIDVIYIDPPYNTGAKDWKYNNNYVDENDGFRHSKWLNMMEKRLRLAKSLLTEKGIIIIAVDHNELFNLGLLGDKTFYEENRIGIVAVVHKSEGRNQEKFFGTSHEYMILFSKNKNLSSFQNVVISEIIIDSFDKEDAKGKYRLNNYIRSGGGDHNLRINKPHFFYPIYVSKDFKTITLDESEDFYKVLPITNSGQERTWKTIAATFKVRLSKGEIIAQFDENEKVQIFEKYRENQIIKTHWIDPKYHAIHYGTNLIEEILGSKKFDFPKSLYLVKDILKVTTHKNAIILDFFAGSGTTGHAVLELNKEDGGNRKFILCTNNENNICTEVTYPRIEKVINGYDFKGKDKTTLFEKKITWKDFSNKADEINEQINLIIEENNEKFDKIEKNIEDGILKITGIKNIDGKKEGLGGNLQYFKTSFVKKTNNRDQVKLNLTRKCTEMLCVKENIFNEEKTEEDFKIFSSNKKDKFLCIYYNFADENFEQFLTELKKLNGKKIIYMFSLDNKIDKNLFKEINNFTIEPIPQNILDVYKQLVKMNIPEKKEIIFIELGKANKKIFEENEKDEGARILRIVLEKTIQKIAQNSGINILNEKGQEEKISKLNDILKGNKTFSPLIWEENKTCLVIGNNAAHGDYDEYELKNVKQFYKHVQSLLDNFI